MLREDSKQRPDFLQLEGIYKDLLRQKDCERLFSDLIEEIIVPQETEDEHAGSEVRREVSKSTIQGASVKKRQQQLNMSQRSNDSF